ncbi:MAG: class I SAM-dependent methyltransferase [Pseudomonadota bacterium]
MTEPTFNVPRHLRRGGKAGNQSESVASAIDIIDLTCRVLKHDTLAGLRMLDMGCGVKLVQAILEEQLDIGRYAGIDVYAEQIEFLVNHVRDKRFEFHHMDTHNEMYNPDGEPLNASTKLPLEEHSFDIITLFSVFTHLAPHDYVSMLKVLRNYVKPDGKLLFSLYLNESTAGGHGFIDGVARNIKYTPEQIENYQGPPPFRDWFPDRPLQVAVYSREHAIELVQGTGWHIESVNDPEEHIQHFIICTPE